MQDRAGSAVELYWCGSLGPHRQIELYRIQTTCLTAFAHSTAKIAQSAPRRGWITCVSPCKEPAILCTRQPLGVRFQPLSPSYTMWRPWRLTRLRDGTRPAGAHDFKDRSHDERKIAALSLRRGVAGAAGAGRRLGPTRRQTAQSGTQNGEWRTYGGDLASTRYSPLDQINAANFSKLEVAWRFKTDTLGPRPEFNLQATPLMVGGRLYSTAGTRRAAVALDAADRRDAVDAQRQRGRARRGRPASALGPRPRLLDRRARRSASSTSRPAIRWSRSMRRPAAASRASARTASSI